MKCNEAEASPIRWQVCFVRRAEMWWVDRFVPGRFKHVSVAGWISDTQTWVFFDINLWRTSVKVLPLEAGDVRYALAQRHAKVLKVKARRDGRMLLRFGFWCVPGVKHLLGVRSGALLPAGLWRDLVRSGAEPI